MKEMMTEENENGNEEEEEEEDAENHHPNKDMSKKYKEALTDPDKRSQLLKRASEMDQEKERKRAHLLSHLSKRSIAESIERCSGHYTYTQHANGKLFDWAGGINSKIIDETLPRHFIQKRLSKLFDVNSAAVLESDNCEQEARVPCWVRLGGLCGLDPLADTSKQFVAVMHNRLAVRDKTKDVTLVFRLSYLSSFFAKTK